MEVCVAFALSVWLGAPPAAAGPHSSSTASPEQVQKYRQWIQEMKVAPRGPFSQIRWFCADGSVLPPKAYACKDHGGGIQHGEWTKQVQEMRANGYWIANVLASVDPRVFVGASPDLDQLSQIVVERFLIQADDGWVFRKAFGYRGALQAEDEENGATNLMLTLLRDRTWRKPARYGLLREAARLLPLEQDTVGAAVVRRMALEIARDDEGFQPLRIKIHGSPNAADAQRVRDYAASGKPGLEARYEELARHIDALYSPQSAPAQLLRLADTPEGEPVAATLKAAAKELERARGADMRLSTASRWLATMRTKFHATRSAEAALVLLQASLVLEGQVYTAGAEVVSGIEGKSRRERLADLLEASDALYGAGFLSLRQQQALRDSVGRIESSRGIRLQGYRQELRYLSRASEWASRSLEFHFARATARLQPIEPHTHMYTQDRLRGSPLLVFGAVIDSLVMDANELAGIQHELFGQKVGAGLRALNPGLTRGRLYVDANPGVDVDGDGIYLLPETVSDLPPVSGILTRGEGSSLSHVQLLARNLGIPNVVVTESVLPQVSAHDGEAVVMAVSPKGVVQLSSDGPRWDDVFGKEEVVEAVTIRPDLEKLDTTVVDLVPLADLRAEDSGRISGPKGANLGSLRHYFGDAVPDGFVVPFGVFRMQLEKPLEAGGPSLWSWMIGEYDAIARLEGSPREQQDRVRAFLSRLRTWIENVDLSGEFRDKLQARLRASFGQDGSYGAFVRSDTNVEDLPGFTGAGLNLTVPNVVGERNIEEAIKQVWASPFTERAYSWRQAHMADPEYVFPAVVVQYSLPSQKSGVMVTADLEGDNREEWISLAVSEGVGGAVDGQATESLRINKRDGEVRLLAQATAPMRTVLLPKGGVASARASGTDAVLHPEEIEQLIAFAEEAPDRFPSLRTESGEKLPADIEFAFRDGKLFLLQLRPFVESGAAQSSAYLASLDKVFRSRGRLPVDLDAVGQGGL